MSMWPHNRLPDYEFEDWSGLYSAHLPDSVATNITCTEARSMIEYAISKAGYSTYFIVFDRRVKNMPRIEYIVKEANGKEIMFATIEWEQSE